MAMTHVGFATLGIIPSARGFAGQLQGQISAPVAQTADRVGKTAGSRMGKVWASATLTPLRAVGTAALGLFAVGKVTSLLSGAIAEAREGQKVAAITEQTIRATGGAAKITAEDVGRLATAISNKTGIDDEAIQTGANLLLTFKNVRNEVGRGNDIFNRATAAAADLSAAGFGDLSGASKQLGKALNDPLKGITALSRAGVTFTAQQQAQIKKLVETGNLLGAQKIILAEVESQVGGVAAASATAGEKSAVAWGNLKEQIGTALLPVLDKAHKVFVARLAPAISGFVTGMTEGTGAGGRFIATVTGIGSALARTFGFVSRHRNALGSLVVTLGTAVGIVKAVVLVTKAWALAQAALNVVMALNPIGLVVIAIAALAAGLVFAWKRSETFRTVVTTAFNAVKVAVGAVVGFFKDLPGNIADAIGDVKGFLVDKGKAIVNGLWTGVKATADFLFTWFVRLPVAIVTRVGNVSAILTRKGVDLVVGLAKGVYSTAAGLFRWWAGLNLAIVRFVGDTARTLFTRGVGLVTGLAQGVYTTASGLFRWWAGLPAAVVRFIGNTAVSLHTKGQDFVAGLARGVSERATGVFQYFRDLPGNVVRGLGVLSGTLKNAGRDLIQGLINGIKEKFGDVKSTLADLTSHLTDWKGPRQRDRSLLAPAGQVIIDGLRRGMESRYAGIRASLGGLTADLGGAGGAGGAGGIAGAAGLPIRSASRSGQLDAGGLPAALSRIGALGNQIVIHVHGSTDPEATARVVGRHLAAKGV